MLNSLYPQDPSLDSVRNYYGKVLSSSQDLKTSACCVASPVESRIREALKDIHPDVLQRFYGCGSPIPTALEGLKVLDLGSGSGRDCYILSRLVGEQGKVIGVDMTPEQIQLAAEHLDYHREKFSFAQSNVEFREGLIEDLESCGIPSNSVDLVVSNCVINLSPAKKRVFAEAFRVLKPGGEMYFSDVFCNRRLDPSLREDPVLLGECLAGAMYTEDFRRLMLDLGCRDIRVMSQSKIDLVDEKVREKMGAAEFFSITFRAFKLDLEDKCEDYGQIAIYKGTLKECPQVFVLDDHHSFEKGRPYPVCSNTADMLNKTRFASHFEILGNTSVHYGLFDCGPTPSASESSASNPGACC